ncbi:MAG: DinB family protein [Chitinophagales bacterium]
MSMPVSIFVRLQHQHEVIGELCSAFSETQLKARVNPEKWSAFENIAHLAAYQPTFIQRLDIILRDEKPTFQRYKAEDDPLFHEYLLKNMENLYEDINENRMIIIGQLEGLDKHQLNYFGIHPKFGKMTLTQWAEFFLLHEAHHLFTIFMLTRQASK